MTTAVTTSSNRNNGVPRWARISRQSDEPSGGTPIPQEEMVMRHFCYRSKVQQRIERSHLRAYKRSFDQIREPLNAFFKGTETSTARNPSPTKRLKVSKYCMEAATSHHPLLLPIGTFQSPSCILDRQILMTNFVSYWKAADPRTAVVYLPRLLGSLRATLELVVQACLEQEEELGLRHYLQHKLRKNTTQHASYQDVLLLWASHTRSMDSILVCLEDAGDFSNQKSLHDFINILAEVRSSCHAPISLVLVADKRSNNNNFLPSSSQARVGLRVQRFSVDHDHLLEQFWNLYTTTSDEKDSDNDEAFTAPPSWIWQKLRQEYWNYHRSICQTVHHLHQIVTQWYAQPGCWFLEASATPTLQHLAAWFATYVSAKGFLSNATGYEKLMSLEELEVTNQQRQALVNICNLLQASFFPRPLPSTVSSDSELLSSFNSSEGQLLSTLFKIRTDLAGTGKARSEGEDDLGWKVYLDRSRRQERKKDVQTEPLQNEDFLSFINQLIVLVGSAQREKEEKGEAHTTCQEGINSMLKEFSNEALQRSDELGRSLGLRNIMLLPNRANDDHDGVWETAHEATSPQLRREIVATLDNHTSQSAGLKSSAGILQAIFRDRVSISREEWFSHFCSIAQSNNNNSRIVPPEELTHWFVLGSWFLYQCGLVKQGKLQRKGIMYEKASVVWCSGDD